MFPSSWAGKRCPLTPMAIRKAAAAVSASTTSKAAASCLRPDEVRLLDNRKAILFVRGERPMLDDKYDLMRHPNVKLTEGRRRAPPYDYTQAKDAADDLDYSPEQYENFELLDLDDL